MSITLESSEMAGYAKTVRSALTDVEVSTITTHGKGLTDHVRVFVPGTYNGKPTIHEITFAVAQVAGYKRIVPGKGIPVGGGNYNKALHVLDGAARSLGMSFDQGSWREL